MEAEVTVANPLEVQAVVDEFFADPENAGKELLIAVEGGAVQRVDETFTSTYEAPSRARTNPSSDDDRAPEEESPGFFSRRGNAVNRWGEDTLRPAIKRTLGMDE